MIMKKNIEQLIKECGIKYGSIEIKVQDGKAINVIKQENCRIDDVETLKKDEKILKKQ